MPPMYNALMEDAYYDSFDDDPESYGMDEWDDDSHLAQYDDDPSPYDGNYSED